MEASFVVRPAVLGDASVLARHRVGMFADMGKLVLGSDEARAVEAGTVRFLCDALPAGDFVAWVAEERATALGSGAALLRRLAPGPGHAELGTEAYLLSFYTEPSARRRGVARQIMVTCLAWCRERGISRITLHATEAGRRVYTPLGFVPRTNEMIWDASHATRDPLA